MFCVLKKVHADVAPKGHYEITGRGVEYVWGIDKMLFRKENAALNDDKRVNNLNQRMIKIAHDAPVEIA